jgi:hypothetical protein
MGRFRIQAKNLSIKEEEKGQTSNKFYQVFIEA